MSYKRASIRPLASITQLNRVHRAEALLILQYLQFVGLNLIYIDETSFNNQMFNPYTWGKKGESQVI